MNLRQRRTRETGEIGNEACIEKGESGVRRGFDGMNIYRKIHVFEAGGGASSILRLIFETICRILQARRKPDKRIRKLRALEIESWRT
ncbi:hypothetical protein QCE47_08810 [Caballeronia sp. LZ025]|jgi:hypothetical protein|uniref:hypothetical protein n=1 Tax=Caballeronia TaxID=1827195 RepID=UPI001FD33D62|nr:MULTISPECIES: hypothetical protein [Caballeronia]MDR5732444.1 hypothetical protein [Caballeronia sp. LZ025]